MPANEKKPNKPSKGRIRRARQAGSRSRERRSTAMPPEPSEEAAVPQEATAPEGREPTMPPEPPEEAPASLDTSISEETGLTTPHEQREEVPAPPEATLDTSISEETELTMPHEQREEVPAPPEATITEKRVTDMPMVSTRKEQFLIARTGGPLPQGVQPVDLGALEQALKEGHIPGSAYKKTLTRRDTVGALAAGLVGPEAVIVAELDQGPAAQLQQHPGLIVERDHRLRYTQPAPPLSGPLVRDPGVVIPNGTGFTATLIVMGEGGTPIEGAEVYLYGSLWPVQGVTDAGGRVQLTLFGEASNSVRALYVKPKSDYWSLWITRPALDPQQDNTISLTPLNQTFPGFPDQQVVGWGLKAMKVDRLPPQYQGKGVKVAVIDSGAATSHQLLLQVKGGWDTITDNNETWRQDVIFHGSHCSGVIAGHSDSMLGIRGIAPEAEVYAYKIFPEGRFSNLIEALDLCIEQKVDVVNLSLGSDQPSELVEQKIQEAKRLGIACIVAAENSGGRVQYPASSAHVLAVAAIGKQGEFPPESYHSTQVLEDGAVLSRDGYFAAKFSCFGPEIGVCGPGVAILSSVPPNNYAAWDGTSMAAPHVTGLATLILAHHPDFKGPYRVRNAQRVERLFQILKQSAQSLNLGNPHRTGAGLPDALMALNVAPVAAISPSAEIMQRLVELLQSGAVPQGNGGAAVGATAPLPQLRAMLERAGLLPGGGAGVAPQSSAPGSSVGGATAPLPQLRAVLERAGLL